jgi:hypothetical protein
MMRKIAKRLRMAWNGDESENFKIIPAEGAMILLFLTFVPIGQYIFHSNYFAAESLSHPSIILAGGNV